MVSKGVARAELLGRGRERPHATVREIEGAIVGGGRGTTKYIRDRMRTEQPLADVDTHTDWVDI